MPRRRYFKFKQIPKLSDPIKITGEWTNRTYYSVRLRCKALNNYFRIYCTDYEIKFHLDTIPPYLLSKVIDWCFREILYIIANNSTTLHKYGLTKVSLQSPYLNHAVNLPTIQLNESGVEEILYAIMNLLQSDKRIFLEEGLEIHVQSSDIPLATGRA